MYTLNIVFSFVCVHFNMVYSLVYVHFEHSKLYNNNVYFI